MHQGALASTAHPQWAISQQSSTHCAWPLTTTHLMCLHDVINHLLLLPGKLQVHHSMLQETATACAHYVFGSAEHELLCRRQGCVHNSHH